MRSRRMYPLAENFFFILQLKERREEDVLMSNLSPTVNLCMNYHLIEAKSR